MTGNSCFLTLNIPICAVAQATTNTTFNNSVEGNSNWRNPDKQEVDFATDEFLAKSGSDIPVIVLGKQSGQFCGWVAEELQRYIEKLSGAELPIVTSERIPPEKPLIVVGGPESNPLASSAQEKQLVSFAGLKPEGFVLKAVELEGRPAVVAGGNDETGTMYAALRPLLPQKPPAALDTDVADVAAADKLVRRIQARYPTAKLGAELIFRVWLQKRNFQ